MPAKLLQLCLILCNPVDCSSPGFSRYSPGTNTAVDKPFPSSGDLVNPGIEPRSLALKADSLTSEPPGKPWEFLFMLFFNFPLAGFNIFFFVLNFC